MKGFTKDDQFHPITDYKKGVRKSRDQSAKTEGVRKAREEYTVIYPYEGKVYHNSMTAPYNVRLPSKVIQRLDSMGGLYEGFRKMFNAEAIGSTGGHFGQKLQDENLREAWMRADFQNRYNLMQLTGMDWWELEIFAYNTTHPDEQIGKYARPVQNRQYMLESEGGTTGIEDQRRMQN